MFVVSMTLKKMSNRSRKVLLSASNESFIVGMCFSILPKTSKYHPHKENTQWSPPPCRYGAPGSPTIHFQNRSRRSYATKLVQPMVHVGICGTIGSIVSLTNNIMGLNKNSTKSWGNLVKMETMSLWIFSSSPKENYPVLQAQGVDHWST